MYSPRLLVAQLFLIMTLSSVEQSSQPQEILSLNLETFQSALKQYPNLLVQFYAPWCVQSQKFTSQYQELLKKLKHSQMNVTLAKVDASKEVDLAKKYKSFNYYPILKLFKNGNIIQYNQPKKATQILSWLEKQLNKQCKQFNTQEELEKYINEKTTITYIGNNDEKFKNFKQTARQFSSVNFLYKFSHVDNKENGQITLYKNFEEKQILYNSDYSIKSLSQFINVNYLPTVISLDESSSEFIFYNNKTFLLLLLGSNDTDSHQSYEEELWKAAQKIRGKIVVVKTSQQEQIGIRMHDFLNLNQNQTVCLIVKFDKYEDPIKYKLKQKINQLNILNFFEKFQDGLLLPYWVSQQNVVQDENDAFSLTADNFHRYVFDEYQDVLVGFYNQKCVHCEIFQEEYKNFKEKFKNKDILIAKIDLDQNEIPNLFIDSFPALYFYKKGLKNKPLICSKYEQEISKAFQLFEAEFYSELERNQNKKKEL